jgi:hypothetical protein
VAHLDLPEARRRRHPLAKGNAHHEQFVVCLGAHRVRDVQAGNSHWTTFADIEGNEFDLIAQ